MTGMKGDERHAAVGETVVDGNRERARTLRHFQAGGQPDQSEEVDACTFEAGARYPVTGTRTSRELGDQCMAVAPARGIAGRPQVRGRDRRCCRPSRVETPQERSCYVSHGLRGCAFEPSGEDETGARARAMPARAASGAFGTVRSSGESVNIGFEQHAHSVMNTCLGHGMPRFVSNVNRIAASAFAST